ncbi:MAG TPA: glycosyltransferase, partial [Capillimicrobium sp.]
MSPTAIWILDDGLVMGGGQGFALRLAEALREQKVPVRFLAPAGSRFGAEVGRRGFPIVDVSYPSLVPPAVWAMPRTVQRLRRALQDVPAGGIVVGNTARCQAYASLATLTVPSRAPLVHLMHEQDSAHRRSARAVYRRIGSLVVVGENGARSYRERLPGVPVYTVHNFLSPDELRRVA